MHQEEVQYTAAGANCHSTVCYDNNGPAKKPAVLIVHAFEGKTAAYVKIAQEVAKQGYVAVAVDMYGEARTDDDYDRCVALMSTVYADRSVCRQRLLDTYEWVKSLDNVDADKVAIMGYCFGGSCALDLARANAPIKAAISIHGALTKPDLDCAMTSKVLILHGYDDTATPFTPELPAELDSYGVDWQAHLYGGTLHAFTNPDTNKITPPDVCRYNPTSSKRAWQSCLNFLAEVFA